MQDLFQKGLGMQDLFQSFRRGLICRKAYRKSQKNGGISAKCIFKHSTIVTQ